VAVSAPVLNEPDVPEAPLGEEVHEALLVDDHEIVVLALYAIEVDAAESDTVGGIVLLVLLIVEVVPPPPPHEASPETANSIAKISLGRTLEVTGLLRDILMFLSI